MITSEQLNNFKEGQICFFGTGAYSFTNLDLKRKKVNLKTHGAYIDLSVSVKHFLDDFEF